MESVEDLCKQISSKIEERANAVLKDLCSIWKHSYRPETIANNCEKLIDHVNDLFIDIVEEAESVKEIYINELEDLMKELSEKCKLLSEPLPSEYTQELVLFDAIEILKKKLENYNEIYLERQGEINSLLLEESKLCKELGFVEKGLITSPTLPSTKELESFKKYLLDLENEKLSRKLELAKLRNDLARIFEELEIKPSLDFEAILLGESDLRVTDAILARVRITHTDYLEKLERSKNNALELRERLSQLWERLEEDVSVRNAFLQKHTGHGDKTVSALRAEIAKCEERKRNNIKVFIDKIREEIGSLWDKCLLSQDERSDFVAYHSDFYNEDLLTLHEMKVEELKLFYDENQKMFELLNKRQKLWEKLTELEQRGQDTNRYNNRGGKLLQEEKERKKIAAQLPKVEDEILSLAIEYTRTTGKLFKALGEDVETLIKNKHMERRLDKECQLSARKQAKGLTPIASSTRNNLLVSVKSNSNVPNTPVTSKRRRSPVLTPRYMNSINTKFGSRTGTPLPSTSKCSSNVLSVKKVDAFKRRSGPKKSTTKLMKKLTSMPAENLLNTSKTYAQFKTHLTKNSHLRSSIAPSTKGGKEGVCKTPPQIIISQNSPPPSTSRVTRQNTFSTGLKSNSTSKFTRSSSALSPGSLANKLSTKNLPIII